MDSDDIAKVTESICPLMNKGEVSLLLGAGFSLGNETATSSSSIPRSIPSGDGLRDMLLNKCSKKPGPRTSLKDAYILASRTIPNFQQFLEECFTVKAAKSWQERIFQYVWNRIYTTNVDNVLDVAFEQARRKGILAAEFSFFNYTEPQLANNAIGTVPIVTIHGTLKKPKDGFIFSNLEYAHASGRILDWHNELAAKIMVGGLIVIGNQLDEADIDSHLAARQRKYGSTTGGKNWIVMPHPDEIKRENYIAAGFDVIDATAEEFFTILIKNLPPCSIDQVIQDTVPAAKVARRNLKAMTWFKEAFRPVLTELDQAKDAVGVLRHFITGADPDWFYIFNSAHATTSKVSDLIQLFGNEIKAHSNGVSVINVTGASGSGKTTAIRAALYELVKTYPYIYEFDSANGIDVDLLTDIVERFISKSIIVFYSAAEYYYAVNVVADRLKDKDSPLCLFILEDRTYEYMKSRHQLMGCDTVSKRYEMGPLLIEDAERIAQKIDDHGMSFQGFSELPLNKRAGRILDKERGFNGDLLSALFSLTTHENFEQKIYQDYHSVESGLAKYVLDVIAIMNSHGFPTPINYVAGFLQVDVDKIEDCLEKELSGIVTRPIGSVKLTCRHRIIADYYFINCIAGNGTVYFIMQILEYLSRQFSINEIKYHPLPYKMYKNIISIDFLFDKYFPANSRKGDTERTYHEAQKVFGKDGVFWLHFGRFYRKIGDLDSAIDCFKTGLTHYNSFQTRHLLGTVLLEKYVETECSDEAEYLEGITILDTERLKRGVSDAYPTSTLCDLLLKIVAVDPNHNDAKTRLKECVNYGLKNFKADTFFERKLKEYIALGL